jgi:succinate-semialdehyde dehydrogenase/glutarate-semialdehyde dehydrogenase
MNPRPLASIQAASAKRRSWSRIADRQRGAGTSVGEITGRNLKKCILALGGSDPFIVLDSVNMDKTVATAAFGRLANTGQSCVAAKRFIVMADLHEKFVSRPARTSATPRPGDPADAATTLGAQSSRAGRRPDRPGARRSR